MSLVGSLEDLGLGEILQIVSLSGKSGVLVIRSPEGEGRIVFRAGQILGALAKDAPADLAELLAERGVFPRAQLDALEVAAERDGIPLDAVLARRGLDADRLDDLRQSHVEACVLRMFAWRGGEFSFEIGSGTPEGLDEGLLLRRGMNAQFLALEGTRLRDEQGRGGAPPPGAARDVTAVAELLEDPGGEEVATLVPLDEEPLEGAAHASVRPAQRPPIVAVDPDLAVLEWIRSALDATWGRIHIFQRSEDAIARIRQYVMRGEVPVALVTTETPPDPLSGAGGWSEIAARLRIQVPQIPIVLLASDPAASPAAGEGAAPDAVSERPAPADLAEERGRAGRNAAAERLREAVERARHRLPPRR